ncbi:hypothetical protein CATRI_01945 [Corynebacterium atrinae]|uniref:DUF6286 domain-containing protein n=1 Tax=Corynebacterium atrinae TaxID=1336740 RepID=UPI0025B2C6F8|nr:DUF6286 domain-containing protein [Corynebacterium atrinae]WJY62494.1 hypothetical protein CATRI_01945 [Corynebacterium atrinae]
MSADTPRATPLARYVAVVIGLLLIAVAVVCGRELYLRTADNAQGHSWVDPVVMTIGNATFQPWMLPVAIVALVVGVAMLWISIRPRTKTHLAIDEATGIWLRPVDVARYLSAAARSVPGVGSAHTRVDRSKVHVTYSAHPGSDPDVESAARSALNKLGLQLDLRVHQNSAQHEGGERR